MLVSHEVPICLLEESNKFNDYDYCLAHLYIKYQKYRDFYIQQVKNGRHVLLDNSAYELRNGEYFDANTYLDIINELNPTEYIIPDVFDNVEQNLEECNNWFNNHYNKINNKDIRSIGVIHGHTYDDMIKNYISFATNRNIYKIAINFDEKCYQTFRYTDNESLNRSYNRMNFIFDLKKMICNKPHHILGCHVPQEFKYYQYFDFIETIDTSNPIMAGCEDIKYDIIGLLNKPKTNIDSIINKKLNNQQISVIIDNVNKFKSFLD